MKKYIVIPLAVILALSFFVVAFAVTGQGDEDRSPVYEYSSSSAEVPQDFDGTRSDSQQARINAALEEVRRARQQQEAEGSDKIVLSP